MKEILIIEREYGCGAAEVAEKAAERLGWRLWDRELTLEMAAMAKVDPEECARREERMDSWLYRLAKAFWRGSYEHTLPDDAGIIDADRMVQLVEHVLAKVTKGGRCVVVGRGAPYFLRNRSDTFSVFLYGPRASKVERMAAQLGERARAEELVDSVDRERAQFIKHYYGKDWPNRHLYHLMINTIMGIDATVDLIIKSMDTAGENTATKLQLE